MGALRLACFSGGVEAAPSFAATSGKCYKALKSLDGGISNGKVRGRIHPAGLRPLSQRGRVSISKGRSVRREKCPRRPGGDEGADRSGFSKHAGDDHRRPVRGRLRPVKNY